MGKIIASSLRLHPATFFTHTPECVVHQLLTAQIRINQPAKIRFGNGVQCGPLGFTQRPGFFHLIQVAGDHVLDRNPCTVRPLNCAWHIQLRAALTRPGLRSLFSGEGLALLVDLHSVALDADLSRVAHSPIRQFSCPDSRYIESGTRQF